MNTRYTLRSLISDRLLLIVLLAFAIRMFFFFQLRPWDHAAVYGIINNGDAGEYHILASSLIKDGNFSHFGAYRTPGYPVFVALIYLLSSKTVWPVLLIQIFLNILSLLVVYKIASNYFNRTIALVATFLFAIDITQAMWTVYLYTDTLFVLIFLLSVFFLLKSLREPGLWPIIMSAFFLGTGTLVRPVTFLFPFAALMFFILNRKLTKRLKLRYSVVFCTIFMICVSPWLIHNYAKYGEAKLSSISGFNLLFYNAAFTEVYKTGEPVEKIDRNFMEISLQNGSDTTDIFSFKNAHIYTQVAKQYIENNFLVFSERHVMGIINMYASLGINKITDLFKLKFTLPRIDPFGAPNIFSRINSFFQSQTAPVLFISLLLGLYLLVNYLFALYGAFIYFGREEQVIILFFLIIAYFSILTGVIGYDRYRLPFMPFINILCSAGIYSLWEKRMSVRKRKKTISLANSMT